MAQSVKSGSTNNRDHRLLSTDFGISYKEVSDLGKLIRACAKEEHKVLKPTADKVVHANVLERWINDTLSEAKLNLPGCISKNAGGSGPTGTSAVCVEFGVDRLTLLNTGISSEGVDKLYRSMFSTTVGFYQIIKEVIDQADSNKLRRGYLNTSSSPIKTANPEASTADPSGDDSQKRHTTKASLLTALWRSFAVLLEYTYTSEYKSHISVILADHEEKLREQEAHFNKLLARESDKHNAFKEQFNRTKEEFRKACDDRRSADCERQKLATELQGMHRSHEQEVVLRLRFEEKLNNLHSLNRSFHEIA